MPLREDILAALREQQRKPRRQREPAPADYLAALGMSPPPEGEEPAAFVAQMDGADHDAYSSSRVVTTYDRQGRGSTRLNLDNITARLLVRCTVDANWERLLRDEDAALLGTLPQSDLTAAHEIALRLNGLTAKTDEELAEAALKNGQPAAAPSA